MHKLSFIIFLMLATGGTLFAIIAWREWRSVGRIIKMGENAQGVVVEMFRRSRKVGETGTPRSFAPVVLFTTAKGEQRKYYSTLYTALDTYQIGQTVDIWYLPDEPDKATLKGGDAWILPVVFGIFGAVMCLIGYPGLFKSIFR
ncbi:MAG: DUF3592 domain-containing protein [Saprospiraceae bacterium]